MGERIDCLVDTGSELTLIPIFLVQGLPKPPVISQIKAANGTLIEVLGEWTSAVSHPTMWQNYFWG